MSSASISIIRTYAHHGWRIVSGLGLGSVILLWAVSASAHGRILDKSDLHPGLDVLQRHRCVAEHDYERWNEQLDVERRFGWRQFEWRQFEWRKFERGSRR